MSQNYAWVRLHSNPAWQPARLMDGNIRLLGQDLLLRDDSPDIDSIQLPLPGLHAHSLPKPWGLAPSWAQWRAQQPDGSWWWFEQEPELDEFGEWITQEGREAWATENTPLPGIKERKPEHD